MILLYNWIDNKFERIAIKKIFPHPLPILIYLLPILVKWTKMRSPHPLPLIVILKLKHSNSLANNFQALLKIYNFAKFSKFLGPLKARFPKYVYIQVLFAQSGGQVHRKAAARMIPQTAWRVLDAPDVNNDYYLNLLDWSVGNLLCVALNTSVFLWNAGSGDIMELVEV